MREQLSFDIASLQMPHLEADGVWISTAAIAIKKSLYQGSLDGVMDVVDKLSSSEIVNTFRELGFSISESAIDLGRNAILEALQVDLIEAIDLHTDGYGLPKRSLSADVRYDMNMSSSDAIQHILKAQNIRLELLGDSLPSERSSLNFIASQALQMGLQGFSFEGIEGKYNVPLTMEAVADLYANAAGETAKESTRVALGGWVRGKVNNEVSNYVPDDIQRILQGTLSVDAVSTVVDAINNGKIHSHAAAIGLHRFTVALKDQGFDINAPTVEKQAELRNLEIIQPNTERGQYIGPVVGADHKSVIIKYARDRVVELPYSALPDKTVRPGNGDTVRMRYKDNVLTVSMGGRIGHEGGRDGK